jgi:hypothetical protein
MLQLACGPCCMLHLSLPLGMALPSPHSPLLTRAPSSVFLLPRAQASCDPGLSAPSTPICGGLTCLAGWGALSLCSHSQSAADAGCRCRVLLSAVCLSVSWSCLHPFLSLLSCCPRALLRDCVCACLAYDRAFLACFLAFFLAILPLSSPLLV